VRLPFLRKTSGWLLLSALTSACLAPEFRIAGGGSGGADTDGSGGEEDDGSGGAEEGSGGDTASGSTTGSGGDTDTGGTDTGGDEGTGGDDTSGGGDNGGGSGGDGSGGGPEQAILTGVETVGADCTVQTLPAFASLPTDAKFPDPFTTLDGAPVETLLDWECRHREISAQLQRYELGTKPEKPASVVGSLAGTTITVDLSDGSKSGQFTATITYPTDGSPGPFPFVITLQGSAGFAPARLQSLGVALVNFDVTGKIRSDDKDIDRAMGLFSTFTGETDAGALVAWAWGVSRLIDALEGLDEANLDVTRIGVGGCSRFGRGALVAGALDARITLTVARETGTGGTGAFRAAAYENVDATVTCTDRISDPPTGCACTTAGDCAGTLEQTYSEENWFSPAIEEFAGAVDRLPVDQHELMALVAPRPLVVIGNDALALLGRYSMAQGAHAAREVYQAMGVADRIGFVEQTGAHCSGTDNTGRTDDPYDATDAFVRRFLLGETALSTDFWDGDISVDQARWIDWTTPSLE